MKILIQDVKNGRYLAEYGAWTATADDARDFRYSAYAHSLIRREKIHGLRVLFYFEELDYGMKAAKAPAEKSYRRMSLAGFDF
jgi:hypothetical protein